MGEMRECPHCGTRCKQRPFPPEDLLRLRGFLTDVGVELPDKGAAVFYCVRCYLLHTSVVRRLEIPDPTGELAVRIRAKAKGVR